jgi:D-glycero-alpha-D-manno-heptose 1-phosphate guanylyltransferase
MITEALILSGGMGTRLRQAVPDLPKVMAPVSGNPFLYYLIKSLQKKGISHFVFLLGYKHELVTEYLNEYFQSIKKTFVIEDTALGTGGAILNGLTYCTEKTVAITNGDTFFDVNISQMEILHNSKKSDCTLALKPMKNYNRYGSVTMNKDASIKEFIEKKEVSEGNINGGFYLIERAQLMTHQLPHTFSFEKNYLENKSINKKMFGIVDDSYFIDIGIPEDYSKAQSEIDNQI